MKDRRGKAGFHGKRRQGNRDCMARKGKEALTREVAAEYTE